MLIWEAPSQLQWGHEKFVMEGDGRVSVPSRDIWELQWGHEKFVMEGYLLADSIAPSYMELQWGHEKFVMEGQSTYRLNTASTYCFNGAMRNSSWKAEHIGCRTRVNHGFNGAMRNSSWKGLRDSPESKVTSKLLQWGHEKFVMEGLV